MLQPQVVRLPNGQNLTVSPIFAGVAFKANDYTTNRSAFPPGWTIVINEEEEVSAEEEQQQQQDSTDAERDRPYSWDLDLDRGLKSTSQQQQKKRNSIHPYRRPTLRHDHLYISSLSNPSSADFKPATSQTRQIAMMLWATLLWYFHQPEPDNTVTTAESAQTAQEGRPRGEWRININREGIFRSKGLLLKLLRMGLVTTDETDVGDFGVRENRPSRLFVTRQCFWQIDARIFLFTLAPTHLSPATSPQTSRPSSPSRADTHSLEAAVRQQELSRPGTPGIGPVAGGATPAPFVSTSHLPTFFPPHPARYLMTDGVRHPARPPPYRQGETVYVRFIPSLGQYLSFRIASLSSTAPSNVGPWTTPAVLQSISGLGARMGRQSVSDNLVPAVSSFSPGGPSDAELLHKWMNNPRVAHFWGEQGPQSHQDAFLRTALSRKHSFPIIACWDGKPFGYFEIYWAKEDHLGKYTRVGDWDRGIHLLIGEEDFRGPHRVKVWLSALVHYCWLADMRTDCVMLEPRVDNSKLARYCREAGFFKEREISFPNKQANLFKIYRDTWESPEI